MLGGEADCMKLVKLGRYTFVTDHPDDLSGFCAYAASIGVFVPANRHHDRHRYVPFWRPPRPRQGSAPTGVT